MKHKGFLLFTAVAVIASASLFTQRARQKRFAFQQSRQDRRASRHDKPGLLNDGSFKQPHQPDLDVSLTSNTVPF